MDVAAVARVRICFIYSQLAHYYLPCLIIYFLSYRSMFYDANVPLSYRSMFYDASVHLSYRSMFGKGALCVFQPLPSPPSPAPHPHHPTAPRRCLLQARRPLPPPLWRRRPPLFLWPLAVPRPLGGATMEARRPLPWLLQDFIDVGHHTRRLFSFPGLLPS